jgi:hypothetical protein
MREGVYFTRFAAPVFVRLRKKLSAMNGADASWNPWYTPVPLEIGADSYRELF